jgi:hypothetical protein
MLQSGGDEMTGLRTNDSNEDDANHVDTGHDLSAMFATVIEPAGTFVLACVVKIMLFLMSSPHAGPVALFFQILWRLLSLRPSRRHLKRPRLSLSVKCRIFICHQRAPTRLSILLTT